MESKNLINRLNRYDFDNNFLYTGFKSLEEAVAFAKDKSGELLEIGFLDGNDNPVADNSMKLLENSQYFIAIGGPGYKVIHSNSEYFKDLLDAWIKRMQEIQSKSLEEQYISDSDNLISEDGVFVLRDGVIEKVTSRERVRYFHNIKVYEIGVKVMK